MVEPSFQGVNRLFVLAFENDTQRTLHTDPYQPIKNDKVTYENIRKICTGFGDDYTTGCLLDYPYFKDSYKIIAVDLSKQQALDADPRAIQQINFTAKLDRPGNTKSKINCFKFCTRHCKSIVNML